MSQQINLFNPLFMRREKYFSARTMLQSLGLIAAGMIALYAYALVQAHELERLAADYNAQLGTQRAQFIELGSRGQSKLLEAEVARLEADVKSRRAVLAVVQGGDVGNTQGVSAYFAAFARHPTPGVWLTGFSVGEDGNELRVRGRVLHADLVPAYLKVLNEDAVMRGRLVTELKLVARQEAGAQAGSGGGPTRYVEFDLSAPLRVPAIKGAR
jgi:hypothetical protein